MKRTLQRTLHKACVSFAIVATLLNGMPVDAATFTWTNVTGNWSTAANWNGGLGPAPSGTDPTDILQFGASASANPYTSTNNLAGTFQLNRLEFNSTNTLFSNVIGGNALNFNGATPQILNSGAGGFILNNAITNSGPGALVLGGTGSGRMLLTGVISGSTAVTVSNGNWVFGADVGTPAGKTFTGGLNLNGGTLWATNINQLGGTSGAITFGGGTLRLSGGTVAVGRTISASAAGVDMNFEITAAQSLTLQSVLSGTGDLVKSGSGTLIIEATNTFTGETILNNGTLELRNVQGAGTNGPITVNNGTLSLRLNGTGSNTTIVYGPTAPGYNVNVNGASVINVNNVTANTNNQIQIGDFTFDNAVVGFTGANTYSLRVGGTTTLTGRYGQLAPTSADVRLAGVVDDGGGSLPLNKAGTGRLILLNTANTYDGGTFVTAGTLQVGEGGTAANLGTGQVVVNPGAALSIVDTATLSHAGGIRFASNFNSLSALGVARDFNVTGLPLPIPGGVPVYGMSFALDTAFSSNSIDMSQVGTGAAEQARVFLGAIGTRTYNGGGTLSLLPNVNNVLQLGGGGTLIVQGQDALLGASAVGNIVVGAPQALVLGTTNGQGVVQVEGDQSFSGNVLVRRGSTLQISGAVTTPLGVGGPGGNILAALGGTITNVNNTTTAQFNNSDIRAFGGGTFRLDSRAFAANSTDGRLAAGGNVDLSSSTFELLGANATSSAAFTTTQSVSSIDYVGGNTIIVRRGDTSGAFIPSAVLNTGAFNRIGRGTMIFTNTGTGGTLSFGTGNTQFNISPAPVVTSGMIGANLVITENNSALNPLFVTMTGTSITGATFSPNTINTSLATDIIHNNAAALAVSGTRTMQALRITSTLNTHTVTGGTIQLGTSSAAGQGAGLFLSHSADNTITHTSNFLFGPGGSGQEGLIYVGVGTGGSSIVALSGTLTGNQGLTVFGSGRLNLTGNSPGLTGQITVNLSGTPATLFISNLGALGRPDFVTNPFGTSNPIDLYSGSTQLNVANTRFLYDVTVRDDAQLGNNNVALSGFNSLTVAARPTTGLSGTDPAMNPGPVRVTLGNNVGGNRTLYFGNLTLNHDALLVGNSETGFLSGIAGTGNLRKYGDARMFVSGDSSGYAGTVTVDRGFLQSLNSLSTAKPFGTGAITVNPGGAISLANPDNVNVGQLTLVSDSSGVANLGLAYVGPLPAVTVTSTGGAKAVLGIDVPGYNLPINLATLFGGGTFLGGVSGAGIYNAPAGSLTPDGGVYRLGGLSSLQINTPHLLSGANSVLIGLENNGAQASSVQLAGLTGAIVLNAPQNFTGGAQLDSGVLEVRNDNAVGTGTMTFNGGILRGDFNGGLPFLIQPRTLSNNMLMIGNVILSVDNQNADLVLNGQLALSDSTAGGATRVIDVRGQSTGLGNPPLTRVILNGAIVDGPGGFDGFAKAGGGTLVLTNGANSYTGVTTLNAGFLAVSSDDPLDSSALIQFNGGFLAVHDSSFTTNLKYSVLGTGGFDVSQGLTLTQNPANSITGAGTLVKTGFGTMVLSANNSYSATRIDQGVLVASSNMSLGDVVQNGTITLNGPQGALRVTDSFTTARVFAAGTTSGSIHVDANRVLTSTAVHTGTTGILTFTGPGRVELTGASTNDNTQIGGGVTVSNSSGTATTPFGDTNVFLAGGTLQVSASTATRTLTIPTVRMDAGGRVQLDAAGAAFDTEVTVTNLNRATNGTLVITPTVLGGGAFGNTTAGADVRFVPVNVFGVATANIAGPGTLSASIVAQASATDPTANFVSFVSAANGLTYNTGPTVGVFTTTTGGTVVNVTAPQTVPGTRDVFGVRTNSNISGGLLQFSSNTDAAMGGLLINGVGGAAPVISSNLRFMPNSAITGTPTAASGEGLIYTSGGWTSGTATISGNITANVLTKFGPGDLTLSGTNNFFNSTMHVHQGTLRFASQAATAPLLTVNLNDTAALDLNGLSLGVGALGGNGGTVRSGVSGSATIRVTGPQTATYSGVIADGAGIVTLAKSGIGVQILGPQTALNINSGNNTYTGGTIVNQGTLRVNTTFALGGADGSTPGTVMLRGGILDLQPTSSGSNGVVVIGADGTQGVNVVVQGPATINVARAAARASTFQDTVGQAVQVGSLTGNNQTLTVTGANSYGLRVGGTTTIGSAFLAFNTTSGMPSGRVELAGAVTGSGVLVKTGGGGATSGTLRILGTSNTYAGGTSILAGAVQVTGTSGTPLGTGAVRVAPGAQLRIAGDGSLGGATVQFQSAINSFGALVLDRNFAPAAATTAGLASIYGSAIQLADPFWSTPLDMAAIGNGQAFLGTGISATINYLSPSLGVGAGNTYRLAGNLAGTLGTLVFSGPDNVLTGTAQVLVGSVHNQVIGVTNGSGTILIQNSNNYSGGTIVHRGSALVAETGASAAGHTPFGTGTIELFGQLSVQDGNGSYYNPATGLHNNTVLMRPGSLLRLNDGAPFRGLGDQGRWGDAIGQDLNGGELRFDGSQIANSRETVGVLTISKGSAIRVTRNANVATNAILTTAGLVRSGAGTLHLITGFADTLGVPQNTPLQYDRLVVTGGVGNAGSTNTGAGATAGIAPVWIVNQQDHTYVSYQPVVGGGGTIGFTSVLDVDTPGANRVAYSHRVTSGTFTAGLTLGLETVAVSTATTIGYNPFIYALRTTSNISPGAGSTITLQSGGWLSAADLTVNPQQAGLLPPAMTVNFGSGGSSEALVYIQGTTTFNARMAATGLTKFGTGNLVLQSINPNLLGDVNINTGTITALNTLDGTGGATTLQALNGRPIYLRGNSSTLAVDAFVGAPTTSPLQASNVRATGLLTSDVVVTDGLATITNNGQGIVQRIQSLTIQDLGTGSANVLTINGVYVAGTTNLGASNILNATFGGLQHTFLAGQVTGGTLTKYGNGTLNLLNGTNNYTGGTVVNGSTANTTMSIVASTTKTGTPFGSGAVTVNPGALLRIVDPSNIASNPATIRSDGFGLSGLGLGYDPMSGSLTLPTGVTFTSTGPYRGLVALDFPTWTTPVNQTSIDAATGGPTLLGASLAATVTYIAPTLSPATGGVYRLGGGGGTLNLGGTFRENLLTGSASVEIGAITGSLSAESLLMVGGNGSVLLANRNDFTGDIRVNGQGTGNQGITLHIGNSFALGTGNLRLNGGTLLANSGTVAPANNVILEGDFQTQSNNNLIFRGNVAMSPNAEGATRTMLLNVNAGQTGVTAFRGVISGAAGSNLVRGGNQTASFTGMNTYLGTTTLTGGTTIVGTDVLPNQNGALGNSDTPILITAAANLLTSGVVTIGRDIQASGTNIAVILGANTFDRSMISGHVVSNVGATGSLTLQSRNGGELVVGGQVSGAGPVVIGNTSTTDIQTGRVVLDAKSNGLGINTFSGGLTLQSGRLVLGGDSNFIGSASAPTAIISSAIGTGTLTFGPGAGNAGGVIQTDGGTYTIVNPLGAMATAANTTLTFGGYGGMTFTRNLDINSNATSRIRTFAVLTDGAPVTFSGVLSSSGTAGGALTKTGAGTLVLSGTNTFTGTVTVSAGVLSVSADANLGATANGVSLGGGTLQTTGTFSSARAVTLTANSGVDATAAQNLTLTGAVTGNFTLVKTGSGTVTLNNTANTFDNLVVLGGTAATTVLSGTPFGDTSITVVGGTLSVTGGAAASLSIPTLNYAGGSQIRLNAAAGQAHLTASTALARQTNGVLVIDPVTNSLGGNERLLVSTAPATANGVLVNTTVFRRVGGGTDVNFTTYAAGTGFGTHTNTTTVNDLTGAQPALIGVVNAPTPAVGAATILGINLDQGATISIPTAGVDSLSILGNGGTTGAILLNGNSVAAPSITGAGAANELVFGTVASPIEGLVYASNSFASGTPTISANFTAGDFTKAGPGTLLLSGTDNRMAQSVTGSLRRLTVQEGILRFGSSASLPSGGQVNLVVNGGGVLDTNGLNLGIAQLSSDVTVVGPSGTVAGTVGNSSTTTASTLTISGNNVTSTFAGVIQDSVAGGTQTLALSKLGSGTQILLGRSTFTGGATIGAGQIFNRNPNALSLAIFTGSNGALEIRDRLGLGSGPITLAGGTLNLRYNAAAVDRFDLTDVVQFGPGDGYNITVAALDNYGEANTTSRIDVNNAGTGTSLAIKINNLTINAPALSVTGGNTYALMIGGTTALAGNTTINAGVTTFLDGQVTGLAGNTLTKIGAGVLVFSNNNTGAGANNFAGSTIRAMQGTVETRFALGGSNPLDTATVQLLGAGWNIRTEADGTTGTMNIVLGNNLVVGNSAIPLAAGTVTIDARSTAGIATNKNIVLGGLTTHGTNGSPVLTLTGANGFTYSLASVDMTNGALINKGLDVTIQGAITGGGTLFKQGANLWINSNTSTAIGGTVISTGTVFFGNREGDFFELSNTARLGPGNIVVAPGAAIQFNAAGNVNGSQTTTFLGNLTSAPIARLAFDASPSAINFRAPADDQVFQGGGILAINAVYNQALDLNAIGNRNWFLGSTTNAVGLNGVYQAATLQAARGFNYTNPDYRLGGGGSTLMFTQANVLTNNFSQVTDLIVGDRLVNNAGNSGTARAAGAVILMANNNYTGTTLVNRGSTLDFRGTLATSSFETFGLLTAGGAAGTFVNAGNTANIAPVTLRPGSELRFDNFTGLVSTAGGRWHDTTNIVLDNADLRLTGNATMDVEEVVGNLDLKGGTRVIVQRQMSGRTVQLTAAGITGRDPGDTLSILLGTGSQLGSDERFVISGTPPAVTNGMVAPWIVNQTDVQFVTYGPFGFVNAGFDRHVSGVLPATQGTGVERVLVNAATTINTGVTGIDAWAVRLDETITLQTATDSTARIVVRSGGLMSNGDRVIQSGVFFGNPPGSPTEAVIFNNANLQFGFADGTNAGTSGQISATSITKTGGGNMFINSNQGSFTGDIVVNQGGLFLRTRATAAATSGGNGGTITLEGANTSLGLRSDVAGDTTFANSLRIGLNNPVANLSVDRAGFTGAETGRTITLTGNLTFLGAPGEQGQILNVTHGNSFSLGINGTTTLTGRNTINTVDAGLAFNVNLLGQVTGSGTLIKTGGRNLNLNNTSSLNNWTGGTELIQGVLEVRANATGTGGPPTLNPVTAGGFGSGPITLYGGTLNARFNNADDTTFRLLNTGNSLTVLGSSTLSVDRFSGTGTNKAISFTSLALGSAVLTTAHGNTYAVHVQGTTTLAGVPILNNAGNFLLAGSVSDGGAGVPLIKNGGGDLWFGATSHTYGSASFPGLVINQGVVRFGSNLTESATARAVADGVDIRVNPGAGIRVVGLGNLGPGTDIDVRSSGAVLGFVALRSNIAPTGGDYTFITDTSSGLLQLEVATFTNPINMALVGDGRMQLGGSVTYSATTLGAGSDNTYRLGGLGGTLTFTAANLNVLTGANNVIIGSLATNGNGLVTLNNSNNFTGTVQIARGSTATIVSGGAGVTPLGNAANVINVYGTLQNSNSATSAFTDNTGAAIYANINLFPGSVLRIDDTTAFTGPGGNGRWNDTADINLNGAQLTLAGRNTAGTTNEVVGSLTFQKLATLNVARAAVAGASAQLTVNTGETITRAPGATIRFLTQAAGTLGAASDFDRVVITDVAAQPTVTNGMVPGYYVNDTDNTFVTYGANGFQNIAAYDNVIPAGTFTPGLVGGTAKVDVTGAVTLLDNPTIYALRMNNNISSATGQINTITFGGSGANVGGIISTANATITANLTFGAGGANEAVLFVETGTTLQLTGDLAATGVTKFGAGNFQINKDQTYAGGWVINQGGILVNRLGGLGTTAVGNTVTLNGNSATLFLRGGNTGNSLEMAYTSGKIIAHEFSVIDWDPGADDRFGSIAAIDVNGSENAQLRFTINRNRSVLRTGELTLIGGPAIVQINATNQTSGSHTGVEIANLGASSQNLTKWGMGHLAINGASPSYSGNISIEQGAITVRNNGSLGSGTTTVRRSGVLNIEVANFTPTGTVNYEAGSAERWSVDGARSGAINLGAATLQIAATQTGTATVTLNGGGIEAFMRTDDTVPTLLNAANATALRTVGSGISFVLAGNSFVGQNLTEGSNAGALTSGFDIGIQNVTSFNPFFTGARGPILELLGSISGAGSLTKQGYDTVLLAGNNTYAGGTIVAGGTLRVGHANALGTGDVTITGGGVLDLNGTNLTAGALISGTALAGYVANSATTINTYTINSATNATYHGVLTQNIALVKQGTGTQTLTGANLYTGGTTINAGILAAGANDVLGIGNLTVNGPSAVFQMTTFNENVADVILIDGQITSTTGVLRGNLYDVRNGSISAILGDRTLPTSLAAPLTKSTSGTVTLSGVNTFSGGVTIQAGVLSVSQDANLGAASNDPTFTGNGATLRTTASFGTSRDMVLNLPNSSDFAGFDVVGATNTLNINGTITGTGGFTKSGAGRMNLNNTATGAFDFDGGVTINAGRLHVATGVTLDSDGGVVVNSGGRLTGTGTIDDDVTVNAGGRFSAGSSPGTISISGPLVWNGGAVLEFDVDDVPIGQGGTGVIGTNWDQILVTHAINGTLTINATAANKATIEINPLNPGFTTIANFDKNTLVGYQWLWVTATAGINLVGSDPIESRFLIDDQYVFGPGAPHAPAVPGGYFYVSMAGSQLFINYHPIPEPGSMLLLGLAGLGMGAYGWRRRKRGQQPAEDVSADPSASPTEEQA